MGSIRVVGDSGGDVEQVNHYYPYGGLIGNLSTNPDKQKYKYNGKEYDTMHGLDTYDYGARQWTEGCFVLYSDYSISNGNVIFNMQESKNAVQNFDYKLGGGNFYPYTITNSKGKRVTRYGS